MSVTTAPHGHPTQHNFEPLLWGMIVVFGAMLALIMVVAIFAI